MQTYAPLASLQDVQFVPSVRPVNVAVFVVPTSEPSVHRVHEPAEGVELGVELGVRDGVLLGVLDGVLDGVADGVADGVDDGVELGVLLGVADGVLEAAKHQQPHPPHQPNRADIASPTEYRRPIPGSERH